MTPDLFTIFVNGLVAQGPMGLLAVFMVWFIWGMYGEMRRRDDEHARSMASIVARLEQRDSDRIEVDRDMTAALTTLTLLVRRDR